MQNLTFDDFYQLTQKYGTEYDALLEVNELYKNIGMSIRTGMVDAIEGAIQGTRTLGEVANSVFQQIQRSLIEYGVNALLGALPGPLGDFFSLSGRRQNGGVAMKGSSYLVGERGPEIFTPTSSGNISTSAGINMVVNVDASGTSVEGDEQLGKELGRVLSVAIQSELIQQKRPGGLLA